MMRFLAVLGLVVLAGCQAMMYGTGAELNALHLGMTRAEVVEKLGQPITIGADASANEERLTYRKMAYTLGWSPTLYDVVLVDGRVVRFGAQP